MVQESSDTERVQARDPLSWKEILLAMKKFHLAFLLAMMIVLIGITFAIEGGCFSGGIWNTLVRGDYWIILLTLLLAFLVAIGLTVVSQPQEEESKEEKSGWDVAREASIALLYVIVFLFAFGEFIECTIPHFLSGPGDNHHFWGSTIWLLLEDWVVIGFIIFVPLILSMMIAWYFYVDSPLNNNLIVYFTNGLIILGILLFFLSGIYELRCDQSTQQLSGMPNAFIQPYFCQSALSTKFLDWENHAVVFSLISLFLGIAMAIFQKERERRIEHEEQQQRSLLERVEKQLMSQDPKQWMEGVKNLLNKHDTKLHPFLKKDYERLQRIILDEWDNKFLAVITDRLEREESIDDVLDTIENVLAKWQDKFPTGEDTRKKRELWKNAIDCYGNPEAEEYPEKVFSMWDEYDYLARELCVELLFHSVQTISEKKLSENRVRLFRHPRFQKKEEFLGVYLPDAKRELEYEWPWPGKDQPYRDPDPEIQEWIEQQPRLTFHPFGALRAEDAGPELRRVYVPPNEVKKMFASRWSWIYGEPGSGRTALGMFLFQDPEQSRSSKAFPIFVSVDNCCLSSRDWLFLLLARVAGNLLDLVQRRPDAFLDLSEVQQRSFVRLLLQHTGSCQALLDHIPFTKKDGGEWEEKQGNSKKTEEMEKQRDTLSVRIQDICRQVSPLERPSYFVLHSLLATRPADVGETHIILDIQTQLSLTQIRTILSLAGELTALRVYLKILTLPPKEGSCEIEGHRLVWSKGKINDMLRQRLNYVFQELFNVDKDKQEDVFNIFYEYSQGLPRRMVQLGNYVLRNVAKQKSHEPFILEQLQQAKADLERYESQ